MNISIQIIPHKDQRYNTLGDYWIDRKGVWQFRISDMGNNYYNFFILIHELIEACLCKIDGVRWEDIDRFDIDHPDLDDPGSDVRAPYRKQHLFALRIERIMALFCNVSWRDYEKKMEEVCSTW
jgi:hypothetical protein